MPYRTVKFMINIRDQVSCHFVITSAEKGKALIWNPFTESQALYVIMKLIETSNITFTDYGLSVCLLLQRPEFYSISESDTAVNHQRRKQKRMEFLEDR